jgi:putative phosphoesterase
MVGILANSDGRVDAVAAALDVFQAAGARFVIHCGDVGGRHVLEQLARVGGGFVWGDRDRDRMGLLRYAQSLGVECFGIMGEFQIDEKRVAVIHGDDKKLLKRIIDEQQYDYILTGHALLAEDRTIARTRVLNPGPLHGGQARSAVLLEPISGKSKLVAL